MLGHDACFMPLFIIHLHPCLNHRATPAGQQGTRLKPVVFRDLGAFLELPKSLATLRYPLIQRPQYQPRTFIAEAIPFHTETWTLCQVSERIVAVSMLTLCVRVCLPSFAFAPQLRRHLHDAGAARAVLGARPAGRAESGRIGQHWRRGHGAGARSMVIWGRSGGRAIRVGQHHDEAGIIVWFGHMFISLLFDPRRLAVNSFWACRRRRSLCANGRCARSPRPPSRVSSNRTRARPTRAAPCRPFASRTRCPRPCCSRPINCRCKIADIYCDFIC